MPSCHLHVVFVFDQVILGPVRKVTWGLSLKNIHLVLNGQRTPIACLDGCGAVLDTGTSLLTAPWERWGGGFTSMEGKSDSVCWHDGSLPQLGIAHFGDSKWQISGGFTEDHVFSCFAGFFGPKILYSRWRFETRVEHRVSREKNGGCFLDPRSWTSPKSKSPIFSVGYLLWQEVFLCFFGECHTCYDEKRSFYFQRGWKWLEGNRFEGCYVSRTSRMLWYLQNTIPSCLHIWYSKGFLSYQAAIATASQCPKKSVVGNVVVLPCGAWWSPMWNNVKNWESCHLDVPGS